jgi:hypothetical protein
MRRTSTSTERRPSDPNAPADTILDLDALGGISSPAGSCVWHVVGLQRSIREWAMRQGWGGRPVRVEQAQGISIAALGTWPDTTVMKTINRSTISGEAGHDEIRRRPE